MKMQGLLLAVALAPPLTGAVSAQQLGRNNFARSNQQSNARSVSAVGTVASVNTAAQTFTLHPKDTRYPDITVKLAANVTVQKSSGVSANLSDIVPGAEVVARGTLTGTNQVTAQQIMVTTSGNSTTVGGINAAHVAGNVTSINASASTFVVTPKGGGATPVTVSATGAPQVVQSDGSAAALSAVVVGVQVSVTGTATGTNAITAQRIMIFSRTNGNTRGSNSFSNRAASLYSASSLSGNSGLSSYYGGALTSNSSLNGYYGALSGGSSLSGYNGSSALTGLAATTTGTSGTNGTGCMQGGSGGSSSTTASSASAAGASVRMAMRRGFRGR